MKTENVYQYPIQKARVAHNESPAHTGRLKFAVDFIVPEGTPTKASLDGVVVDVKQNSDIGGPDESFDKFGNYMEIEHQNGEYSIYEHIKKTEHLSKKGKLLDILEILAGWRIWVPICILMSTSIMSPFDQKIIKL